MRLLDPLYRLVEGWIDPFRPRDDYEPPARLIPYLWFYVRQAKWAFVAMGVFGTLNALIEALVFSFMGEIVDMLDVFQSTDGEGGWNALLAEHGTTLAWMVGIAFFARIVVVLVGALIEEQAIVPGFFMLMRWQSHKHVVAQSLSYFQNDLAGRITQKVQQSGHAAGDMMISLLQTIWFISAYAVTTFGLLFALNSRLGLYVIVWVAAFLLIARYYIPRIRSRGEKTAEAGSVLTGRLVDGYTNISTVKLYGAHSHEGEGMKAAFAGMYDNLRLFTRELTGVRVTLSLLSNGMIVLVAWQAIDLWLADTLSTGEVAFSLALVLRLSLLMNRLMGLLNGFFRNVGTVENSMKTIAKPIALTDAPDAGPLQVAHGEIEFDNVDFHYGQQSEVLENLSLTIKPGERVGLVGPSGAGKSTIVRLLLRFFDPEAGTIRIDGQNISKVTQDSLRAQFSLVEQETALFQRSVAENIAYGRPDASMDEIMDAARKAKAHDFITKLSDAKGRKGYDARVGERGVKLSGGQRQRIAIARVFLRNAPILILDEATSQLDSEVEAAIQENLFDLMEGKTVIAVAHRLSTIAAMDRLIVIDDGRIVQEGTHRQLLVKGGLYADLWRRQSGGFLAESA